MNGVLFEGLIECLTWGLTGGLIWSHFSCLCMKIISIQFKDGEAARLAWSEMAASLMELVLRLPSDKFKLLLPCIYPALILLTAKSSLPRVRNVMADLLFRLPEVYGFLD